MVILTAQDIVKHFDAEPVLAGASLEVRSQEKLALVGPNGSGKTTLLRILAALDEADKGEIQRQPSMQIGFLRQEATFEANATVWEEARSALHELLMLAERAEEVAHSISRASDAERKQLNERFDQLHSELHRRDVYNLDHRIERILHGLGFANSTFRQPVHQLSGGQQNRLMLAKLLLNEPELMLLDEPSNHLDIEATQWLESYLSQCQQAVIVVSHDRYFLDKVSQRTLELFQGTLDSFPGNYSAYQRQKQQRLEVQRRTHEKQQAEIAKAEEFIRRHHYGQKHAQAEDRRKKLERIELVAPPREISKPSMKFPPASRSGDIVVRAEHLSMAFAEPLFSDLTFDILRGEKWGIVGPNGCGKTTLLRCILGLQKPQQGQAALGTGVEYVYVDQLLDFLDEGKSVVDAIGADRIDFPEGKRRDLLARFGITGDAAHQFVGSLSGGERNRVALAFAASRDANLLILDEPTNHLDLWARDSLEDALREFDGTALFVSHDRYFLNQVADHLLVHHRSEFRVIEGNYDTFLHFANQEVAEDTAKGRFDGKQAAQASSKTTQAKSQKRRRRFPYRKVADLEAEIHQRESRVDELHRALASPDVFRDGKRVKETSAQLEQEQERLAHLYEHWEEAIELN